MPAAKLVRKSKFDRTAVGSTHAPMKHQLVSLAHDEANPVVFDTSDAGTGKTAVRIWAFAGRRREGGGCLLVLAPRSLLRSAWANDFKKFAPDMVVSVATAENREKAFAVEADVYITNHDAVKWVAKQKKVFFERFSELVIDEPTAFKNHTSQRSRAAAKISKFFRRRIGMTATPNSNGICNVWHQAYILDGGQRLGTSFFAFRNSVCVPRQVGFNRNAIEWQDKDGAEEAVFGELADIVIRHKLDDCADIPQTHHYEVPYELAPAQRKAYDQMELAQILLLMPSLSTVVAAKLTNTKLTEPTVVSAVNAAAVATKLLQVCSGAVYDGEGQYHLVDKGRYELILDLVEARQDPSLVFFQWKHQKDQLKAEAEARGLSYCIFDGDAPEAERDTMVKRYQAGQIQVMFAHPRSAAHGLTLTRGATTIWAGPTYDLELYEQGNKRQRRIGQTKKTEVITVLAPNTIEEKVYEMLRAKDKRMQSLLDLFSTMAKTIQPQTTKRKK